MAAVLLAALVRSKSTSIALLVPSVCDIIRYGTPQLLQVFRNDDSFRNKYVKVLYLAKLVVALKRIRKAFYGGVPFL